MKPDLANILIIDIETVSLFSDFEKLSERGQNLWESKIKYFKEPADPAQSYTHKAGIYAEFGKVVTIGMGYFSNTTSDDMRLRVKTIYGHTEKSLLTQFKTILESKFQSDLRLCAHNGKEFDFPFLARRYLINGISIPSVLDVRSRKPWEINHIDTLELWKFGDRKNYTSLDLIAYCLDVETSKSDIDGSQVGHVYYIEKDIERIANYCTQDIVTTAQIFLKMHEYTSLEQRQIDILPSQCTDQI